MPESPKNRYGFLVAALTAATTCAAVTLAASPAAATAAAIGAPTGLNAYVGGDSIGLRWEKASGSTPASYQVYRDGTSVATVTPPGVSRWGTTTARYVDAAVTVGRSYRYQVRATGTDGSTSALSSSVTVTQTSVPVPVVNVVVSPTGTDLAPMLEQARTLIRTWYPKFAAVLAIPDYTAPSTFTVTTAPNIAAGTVLNRTQLTLDEAYARANKDSVDYAGTILHEAAHVLQGGLGGWLPEGLAVWTTHEIYHDADTAAPTYTSFYTQGYDPAAYLIKWISAQSSLNWSTAAHDLNVSWFTSENADTVEALAISRTGRRFDQLWAQMVGGSVQSVRSDSGLCFDNDYLRTDEGNPQKLNGCWETPAQRYSLLPTTSGGSTGLLRLQGQCVDVAGGTVASGSRVVINTCNGAASQLWTFNANGSLQNGGGQSLCVQPVGSVVASGTPLELVGCNGGTGAQHWNRQAA